MQGPDLLAAPRCYTAGPDLLAALQGPDILALLDARIRLFDGQAVKVLHMVKGEESLLEGSTYN